MVEQDDKWKLYYEYATKAADEEIALFQRIDTKAFGFLRMLTAVLGIAGAVAVWVFNHFRPIEGFLEWALAIAIIITLLATITSWSFLFRAIKLRDAPRMPLSDEIHQLFWDEEARDVYFALAKAAREVLKENRQLVEDKGKLISKAYQEISFSAWMIAVDIGLIPPCVRVVVASNEAFEDEKKIQSVVQTASG